MREEVREREVREMKKGKLREMKKGKLRELMGNDARGIEEARFIKNRVGKMKGNVEKRVRVGG